MKYKETLVVKPAKVPQEAPLIIAFSGINGNVPDTVFEFTTALEEFSDCSRIYVRDPYQAWYQMGITDIHRSTVYLGTVLANKIDTLWPTRVITIGSSAGGYAAILYAWMLQADTALAFMPQTFLDSENRTRYKDTRWPTRITRAQHAYANNLDLAVPLSQVEHSYPTYYVYYCKRHRLDRAHAMHIRKCPGVKLVPQNCEIHNVAGWLKKHKLLQKTINRRVKRGISEGPHHSA